jgi:hypothetical protein
MARKDEEDYAEGYILVIADTACDSVFFVCPGDSFPDEVIGRSSL